MGIDGEQARKGRRWPAIGVAFGLAVVSLLIWAANRETAEQKQIKQRLEELRAAGEPLDAASLARLLPMPPPELNADLLLKDALAFARTNVSPGVSPIVMSGASLDGTQAIDASIMNVLRRHYEESAGITNVMPILPPGVRFGEDWSRGVLNAKMVSFVSVRQTLQMLCTRAMYAAEIGDSEGATAMLERAFQFSSAVPSDSSLVSHMIRKACLGLTCTIVERSLNRVQFDDAQLARILATMPLATNDLAGTLRVEHCTAVWVFNEVRSGKRLDDLVYSTTSQPWWKQAAKRLWRPRNEYNDEDFLGYLELMPRALATTTLPPRQAIDQFSSLLNKYASNATCGVAEAVIPNWSKAIETHHEREAQLEATRAALNVERFRLANGRLPESVDKIVPTFAPTVPVDIFNNQPLRIKPLTIGYRVYSVGQDCTDHGGLKKTNASVQTNYDITISVER